MSEKVIVLRSLSRVMIALVVTMGICAILLCLILYSEKLSGIQEAGWAVIGSLGTYLGQSLVSIARALSQNPSDRTKVTEEE